MQKTNFKFEVIIHDDASTDGTRKIIEEYVQKYPDLFVTMFEEENQYSKGVNIVDDLMLPKARGKYIALCEGDDYWCNENKLQMQFDFMESHSECSACFTNSVYHDLSGKVKDKKFNNFKDITYIGLYELSKGCVHTTTHFARKEFFRQIDLGKNYFFGDLIRTVTYLTCGKLAVLPVVTSVYNFNNPAGVTRIIFDVKDLNEYIDSLLQVVDFYKRFDKYSNGEYENIIHRICCEKIISTYSKAMLKSADKKQKKNYFKTIKTNEDFLWCKKHAGGKFKLIVKMINTMPFNIFYLFAKKRYGK